MIYPIVLYGDPVLKQKARDIEQGEIDVKQLAEDMFDTMHAANGIGLAAPQIGKSIRMFVVDGSPIEEEGMQDFKKVFINAEILEEYDDDWGFEEGCLSIPEVRETVHRPEALLIRYYDEDWTLQEEEYEGMKARIIQHEYDHIDGILFTDHLSTLKKKLLKGKLSSISKGRVQPGYKVRIPN